MRIALDAMGSDNHPGPDIEGAIQAAATLSDTIVLLGDEALIKAELAKHDTQGLSLEVVHTPQTIGMHEKPTDAARNKSQSSVHVGMELVDTGDCDAFVSCGNTGAILTVATLYKIKRIRGIYRPVLGSIVPVSDSHFILVDVGANADCKPEHLVQFAEMGTVYAERILGCESARVGLLANGEEDMKGNALVRETGPLLAQNESLNYVGKVEPKDMLVGAFDVLVADGFTGNIFAKSLEAMAMLIFDAIKDEVKHNLRAKAGALVMRPAFRRVYKQHDPFEIGGAPLLGVNGVIIIGHGRSNATAVKNAIRQAHLAVEAGIVQAIHDSVAAKKRPSTKVEEVVLQDELKTQ